MNVAKQRMRFRLPEVRPRPAQDVGVAERVRGKFNAVRAVARSASRTALNRPRLAPQLKAVREDVGSDAARLARRCEAHDAGDDEQAGRAPTR